MNEIWKNVDNYNGYYQVSNLGRVKSFYRNGKILKNCYTRNGYLCVLLSLNNKQKHAKIHRLVATAFIENKNNKPHVNHKNGIRTDNRLENLEWVTAKENVIHSFKELGRKINNNRTGKFGKDNPSSIKINKLSLNGVYIKSYGSMCEAQRETGIHSGTISKCCNGITKKGGGFIWEFSL